MWVELLVSFFAPILTEKYIFSTFSTFQFYQFERNKKSQVDTLQRGLLRLIFDG
jgi:uncharacterized membrane protein YdbT with pleckstrin-like domain